jgi:hypothetical protein
VETSATLSRREARRIAIDAQGLSAPRPKGRIGARDLRAVMARLGVLQLDAINVVERTQFLVLFSRLGAYDRTALHAMTGPGGELFEYWGHAASLLPMETQPLFRWRMEQHGPYGDGPAYAVRRQAWQEANAAFIDATLEDVRDRGPLTAAQLADPRRRVGEWWGRRSVGRQALEWLFARGMLAAWRAPNFERVYDVPERVIPDEILSRPTPPTDEAHRRLLALAAGSLGVATVSDLASYYQIKPQLAKLRVAELVEAGELLHVAVEGWRDRAYVHVDVRRPRTTRRHATFVSPFDSLVWDRGRNRRLFGFDYRIEVYVPEPQRRHGYYVLPLLLDDQLVARVDLKADRKASVLRVPAAYLELGADEGTVAPAAAAELHALRAWLGLGDIAVGARGDFARALKRSAERMT